jgi:hypothetical protein
MAKSRVIIDLTFPQFKHRPLKQYEVLMADERGLPLIR